MAHKPRKKKYDYRPYPQHQNVRSGCKVSWYYYAKKEDAEKAAEVAKHNAAIQWELGYDFGYCSPGSIRLSDWEDYKGLYEVCIP
jgi:Neuraminidase (sialidase)